MKDDNASVENKGLSSQEKIDLKSLANDGPRVVTDKKSISSDRGTFKTK